MNTTARSSTIFALFITGIALVSIIAAGCAGGALTTREKGAGIGALGGAAIGGIVGSAVGHPGAGAAIGTGFGLGAGALLGDQLQGREIQSQQQDVQLQQNQVELERQRAELELLKTRQTEY